MNLATGGAGFIGGNFVLDWLAYPTAESIVNLDELTYAGNLGNLRSLEKDTRHIFVQGDIGINPRSNVIDVNGLVWTHAPKFKIL